MQKLIVTDELIKEAKKYFVLSKRGTNMKYIGPENEYQKWYYINNKEYKNKKAKEWRIINLEYDKQRSKKKGIEHRFLEKLNALRIVSSLNKPCCKKCKNEDIRVLTLNHINCDGSIERNKNNTRVSRLYRDIRIGRKTDDLEVLCFNCNILYEYEKERRNLPFNYKELAEL